MIVILIKLTNIYHVLTMYGQQSMLLWEFRTALGSDGYLSYHYAAQTDPQLMSPFGLDAYRTMTQYHSHTQTLLMEHVAGGLT
jgi:hypothetical protein